MPGPLIGLGGEQVPDGRQQARLTISLSRAYAATVRSLIAVITALNEQVKLLEEQVRDHFGQHPDAEIILSQPGLGAVLGARVLAEFGDDPHRYRDGKARRNYAATSPITLRGAGARRGGSSFAS